MIGSYSPVPHQNIQAIARGFSVGVWSNRKLLIPLLELRLHQVTSSESKEALVRGTFISFDCIFEEPPQAIFYEFLIR